MAQPEKALLSLADPFDEDETERAFLLSKPTCFLIVGKPGTGKATLGKKLSQSWNCIFIEAKELINEHIKLETEKGVMIQELLYKGQSIRDELIIQLMVDKINSAEVAHNGYVLCGLPSLSEEFIKIPEQIELMKNFKLQPDVIINIKCPDKDLVRRLSGLKQDPGTSRVYKREEWDPALKEKRQPQEEGEEEELEEEEEEFDNSKEFLNQLVYRPEDFPENVDERIRLYKDTILRPVEDLMIDHDPQYLIEIDGNKKSEELFESVLSRLEALDLRHGAVVMKLHGAEEEESVESLEGDELMRTLSSYRMMAPKYRWRRSRWGTYCPVALKEGYIKKGLAEFAVSFLDKMYVLSSEESLMKFIQNPRPYLLPPMPLPPCKVAVLGPKSSGKTTLCNLIANKYSGKVFDMSVLIIPYIEEAKQNALVKASEEATEKAIEAVKQKLQHDKLLKAQVHEEEVTVDHPEVQKMVEETIRIVQETPVTLTPDVYVSALDKAISEFNAENKERFPGAPTVGGWVLDNFPNSPNYWIPLAEKGLLPDTVICLKNPVDNGKYLLNRLYFLNKEEIDNTILQRLQKDRERKLQEEEEARKEQQDIIRLQEEDRKKKEEMQKLIANAEELQTEIILPEVPEGGYPDVPEMEPLKQLISTFNEEWQLLEPVFADSSLVGVTFLEIADKSAEALLQDSVTSMESKFDIDEEAEDTQAELEAEEENEDEEGEDDEAVNSEKKKHYGDSKHFCPVALKDNRILYPGQMDYAAIYREKTYYCSSPEARKRFLENPQYYVAHEEPLQAPPLRVLLIGTSGSGKTVNSRWLADKLGLFHIQFKEHLQEIMLAKLEKKIGPQFEEDKVEDDSEEESILLQLEHEDTDEKKKEDNVPQEEVVLTEGEEAVKSYLADNEPLPTEVLDQLVVDWWTKEPFQSAGFVLDGFPSTVEEAQYIGDRGLFPDIAVFLEADESDICDRLLPPRMAKWQERRQKQEERKQRLRDMKKKIRDEQIAKRRAELLAEQKINQEETSQKDAEGSDNEEEEEEEEEEVDNIELILAEEFPEEEEEEQEEEEQEEDAIERMKTEIGEKCESDAESLQSVKIFTQLYGLQHLSLGHAIRSVLENQPYTELASDIKGHLKKGLVVPDDLAIRCLEIAMMDLRCNTIGVVIDGYPATKQQADLLEACSIIPIKIFELELPVKEVLKRGLQDRKDAKSRPYPVHDSAQILSVRNSNYKQEINRIKDFYSTQHQNWCEIDAMRSKWWVANKIIEEVNKSISQIRTYLQRIKEGKAAAIADFCISPHELLSRLGEFGQYCPVSLAQRGELVDCSVTSSLQFAAEFRGHYYKMASQEELAAFLQAPEQYVPPLAPCPLPPSEMLPRKLTVADVKSKFPKNAEMKGYCPVTYVDGKKCYEALVSGHIEHAVEYRDKIYIFESERKLQRFMKLPEKYWDHKLPSKLPPKMEPIMLTSLPLTGYLEQGAATALIKALNDVGCLKPKYPFLSVKRSALLYIAYHLKAYNPRNSDFIRKKYKKKMEQFLECCELITYLGNKMTRKYKAPQKRPVDFDYKVQSFFSLRNVDPTCI
ncbi:hypothetical protein GDO81_008055 [Engystomops pustulosus]|uniref:Nucleoside-diphosphate kinase n=1 Tax=Engystomops pustulosus TaxID=76066 RepID=A0AAV7CBR8_ENGPU|nr:hypothetical protein GDO81_008055 [Engystomops pustulosus]